MTKKERNQFVLDCVEAYMEARNYDNEHLFDDRTDWLRMTLDKGYIEFPDEYDHDTNIWSIGFMMAQVERYGGVVIKTKKYGKIPSRPILNDQSNPFDQWSK